MMTINAGQRSWSFLPRLFPFLLRIFSEAHNNPQRPKSQCSVFTRTQFSSPGILNMGQRTLVLEPGYQSYQRPAGGLYPSTGAFVPSGY